MKKPEVGAYYKTKFGHAFKIVSINETLNYATIEWVTEECIRSWARTWDYRISPELIENKLTSLEIELL